MIDISNPTPSLADLLRVEDFLCDLNGYYPGFSDWYVNRVMPSAIISRQGLILAQDDGNLVGVALYRPGIKAKLRCVRVRPDYQARGLGLRLIDKALHTLNCDKPAVTVPQELWHDYARIFVERYDFDLTRVVKGMYRPGKLEYMFNTKDEERSSSY